MLRLQADSTRTRFRQNKGLNWACDPLAEFLNKILKFSEGNPGAIITMIDMAQCPKYRSEDRIKIAPLYIDFRMQGGAAR
jgi:hypothetical protein